MRCMVPSGVMREVGEVDHVRFFTLAGKQCDIGYQWSGMSYQEKVVGNQLFYAFGFAILLVYLCLAGQYESWIAPLAVILAVPLSLVGPVAARRAARSRLSLAPKPRKQLRTRSRTEES